MDQQTSEKRDEEQDNQELSDEVLNPFQSTASLLKKI